MAAADTDCRRGCRHARTRLRGRWCAPLLLLTLAACGGEQPMAPVEAPAVHVAAVPQPVPATSAAPAPAPAPRVKIVPPAAPYGKLWEEALKQRPWPRYRGNAGEAGPDDASGGGATQTSSADPTHNAPQAEDPDPFHVLPPDWDVHVLAPYLQGVSSWYGPTFHGKLTANGEVYNQYALTAAHPVLPIGTKIQVENLENGRKVWVRINDRGPYAKGRILDLSKLAAQQLDMIKNGTARVRITVLQWPETINPNLGLKAYTQYVVQAAAYPDADEAESLRERIQARFPQIPVMIDMASNGFFAVVAGPFDEEQDARDFSRRMQRVGYTNLVRRYRN